MIGSSVSHYHIERELGRGGMGVVYLAHDELLKREVALKFLPVERLRDEKRRQRFLSEARAASALNHPNILTIHDVVESGEHLFIVMEYIDGETLRDRLEGNRLSLSESVETVYQIAAGLEAAHRVGVIHRDVKPGNIMLTRDGRVKLTDFGLAKLADVSSITDEGQVIGTSSYMSPEQIRGQHVDHRTDIWSLGVTFYEMCSGRRPFSGHYMEAVVYSVLNTEPTNLRLLNEGIPDSLCDIVHRCLRKDRDDRYDDMSGILSDLNSSIRNTGMSLSSEFRRMYAPTRKTRYVLVSMLLFLIFVLGALAIPSVRRTIIPGLGPAGADAMSIAVLPVRRIGSESVSRLLVEGLHYDLTSELLRLKTPDGRISVIPASEVYSEEVRSAFEADSVFGVDHVIMPTLTDMNGVLKLTLALVNTQTRNMVNEVTIEARESNLISIQDEARSVFASLVGAVAVGRDGDSGNRGGTRAPLAYELYLEGEAYLNRHSDVESIDKAIESFEQAVAVDDRYALAYAGLGEAYWRKYDLEKELEFADRAVEYAHIAVGINESLAPVHVTLGLVHLNRGRTREAISAYERALEIEPNRMDALVGLGLCYQRLGDVETAESYFVRVTEQWPYSVTGFNRLGVLHYLAGDYERAARQFRRVTELDPENAWGFNNLSQAYDHLDRQTDSIRLLQKAIDLDPRPVFFRNLTALYFFEGDFASAVETSRRALELGHREYRTWSQLANALYWAKDSTDRAREAWIHTVDLAEDALRVNPTDAAALDYRIAALANLGRQEETFQAIDRLRTSTTLGSANYATLAHAYERLGHRDSAMVYARLALETGIQPKYVLDSPWLEDLRSDARFARMMDQPELMRRID